MEINISPTYLELYYSDEDRVYLTKSFISVLEAKSPAINIVTVNNFYAGRFKKDIVIYYDQIEKINGVVPISYDYVITLLRTFLGP